MTNTSAYKREASWGSKVMFALFIAFLFIVFSAPIFYTFTSGLAVSIGLPPTLMRSSSGDLIRGRPSLYGILIHSLILVLLIYLILA